MLVTFQERAPFEPKNASLVYTYAVMATFMAALTVATLKRWVSRRSRIAFWVAGMYACYAAALVSLFVGMLSSTLAGFFTEAYSVTLPMGYFFGCLANVFLLYFALEVFFEQPSKTIFASYVAFTAVASILVFLPWNYWGKTGDEIADVQNVFQAVTSIVVVAQALTCYFLLLPRTFQALNRVKEPVYSAALKLVAAFIVTLVGFYVCLVLDAVVQLITYSGYSAFVFIGWSLVAGGSVLGYVGFLLPDWFRKAVEVRTAGKT
ncbi:MAG: hypothetical protein Kow0069_03550 [Promethearchaeota archaeon]